LGPITIRPTMPATKISAHPNPNIENLPYNRCE
jgi:hypothetical protein